MVILQLVKPLEKAVKAGHPWIFRDALRPFTASAGEVVTVMDRSGRFLCRGLAEEGPIGVRVFSTSDVPLDGALFKERIEQALRRRDLLGRSRTTALRLIAGEGDFLPGVTLDRYGPYAVLLFDGGALEKWKDVICKALRGELESRSVSTLLFRTRHRHEKNVVALWGALPEGELCVLENGMKLRVDLVNGQKTGLFLDHRDSRLRTRALSRDKRVLNLYGYTGGFSVAAGLGGAREVVTVDSAPAAIALAEKSWLENGLDPARHTGVVADAPTYLNSLKGTFFDLVIADPPSFAPKKSAVPGALKAYRLLHASVLRIMLRDGIYIAASCSSHVRKEMFEATILEAARGCGRTVKIDDIWGAGLDHPVLKGFPEGDYLKVFKVQIVK
jgi:23S rRNA (cytosine1962-C5)-methyltransferase